MTPASLFKLIEDYKERYNASPCKEVLKNTAIALERLVYDDAMVLSADVHIAILNAHPEFYECGDFDYFCTQMSLHMISDYDEDDMADMMDDVARAQEVLREGAEVVADDWRWVKELIRRLHEEP